MALVQSQRTQEPTSTANSLEFFLSSIQDPHNPRHCAVCLDGAFRECTDAEWKPGLRKLKNKPNGASKYDAELWNGIVKFLFIKRTDKQMKRFLILLSECTCRMDQQGGEVRRYHLSSAERSKELDIRAYNDYYENEGDESRKFTEPWRQFLWNLFLSLTVPIMRSGSKSSAKGYSTSWPHSSTDLIPYGADILVASVLKWYQFIPDPLLFNVMASILEMSREMVIPSLVKYKFTEKVIESTKQLLDRILLDYGFINNYDTTPVGFSIFIFHWHMSDTIYYLAVALFERFHEDHKAALFQGCEIKVMQLCSFTFYLMYALRNFSRFPHWVLDTSRSRIIVLGQELFRFFHMHLPSRPSIPVHPAFKEVEFYKAQFSMDFQNTPRQLVLGILQFFRVDTRCSARGCMNSLHTVGKEFRRCVGCGITAYCGPDCQRKEWKHERYPHKTLCPIFSNMVEKVGGDALFLVASSRGKTDSPTVSMAMKTVDSNWSKAQIDDNDLLLAIGWREVVNVSREGTVSPDQIKLKPGFPDYNDTIALLSKEKGAPQPVYLGSVSMLLHGESANSPFTPNTVVYI